MAGEKKGSIDESEFFSFEEVRDKELKTGGLRPRNLVAGVDGKPDVFWGCCPRNNSSQTPTVLNSKRR